MEDCIDNIQKRYDNLFSLGGEVERSYYQKIGKIVNKESVYEVQDSIFDKINKKADNFLEGDFGKNRSRNWRWWNKQSP